MGYFSRVFFYVLTSVLITISGCSTEDPQQTDKTPPPEAGIATQSLSMTKWNSYIDLMNFVHPVVRHYLSVYTAAFPSSVYVEPESVAEAFGDVPHSDSLLQAAIDAAYANASKGDITGLDVLARQYAPALERVWHTLWEINEYYVANAFLDDNFSKGRQLHERLLAAEEACSPLEKAFFAALNEQNSIMLRDEIVHLKGQGQRVQPAILAIIEQGRRIESRLDQRAQRTAVLEAAQDRENEELLEYYENLSEALGELEVILSDSQQIERERLNRNNTFELLRTARELHQVVAEIVESERNNAVSPQSIIDFSRSTYSRELDNLTERYNILVPTSRDF